MIGYCFCGSFCTFERSFRVLEELVGAYELLPIMSYNAMSTDTRFGLASDHIKRVTELCGRPPILTIADAEPLGPKIPLDAMVVAPCTGNTLAKLAAGIVDTPVTMAVKSHLRGDRPVVLAVSTNDALGQNARNIGQLMASKHFYFAPLRQDDHAEKPNSIVADFEMLPETIASALKGVQIQPIIARY